MHTHVLVVTVFLVLYLVKTLLLFAGSPATLDNFTARTKVPEMIVSVLFLLTGLYLWKYSGNVDTWFYVKLGAVAVAIPSAIIGFKKRIKPLAVLSFFLIVYSYGISETKSPVFKKADIASAYTDTDNTLLGKEIYMGECASCHGADGRGGLSGAKDLSLSESSPEEVSERIIEGKGMMPAFGKRLTDVQIDAVATYIIEMRNE